MQNCTSILYGFIAKQRINSGFFLYEAELKKKNENKQRREITKKAKECNSLKEFTDSSDERTFPEYLVDHKKLAKKKKSHPNGFYVVY